MFRVVATAPEVMAATAAVAIEPCISTVTAAGRPLTARACVGGSGPVESVDARGAEGSAGRAVGRHRRQRSAGPPLRVDGGPTGG